MRVSSEIAAIPKQPRPPVENRRWIGSHVRPGGDQARPGASASSERFAQGPHFLKNTLEVVQDEHACLAGGARIDSLTSKKAAQEDQTLVVSRTSQTRNQIIHTGPQSPGLRSRGEAFESFDPRLLREGGSV